MPNGKLPQSQDDKVWKLEIEKKVAELERIISTLTAQIQAK